MKKTALACATITFVLAGCFANPNDVDGSGNAALSGEDSGVDSGGKAEGEPPWPGCKPPFPPGPPPCFTHVVGSGDKCVDVPLLHKRADEVCFAFGHKPVAFDVGGDCGKGDARFGKITCCAPPPPPPKTKCEPGVIATSECVPTKEIFAKVHDLCVSKGLTLTELHPDEACGEKGSKGAKYLCCAGDPLPPPPKGEEPTPPKEPDAPPPPKEWAY